MPESLVCLFVVGLKASEASRYGDLPRLFVCVVQRGYPECNTLPFWTPGMPSRVSWKGPQPLIPASHGKEVPRISFGVYLFWMWKSLAFVRVVRVEVNYM